MGEEQQRFGHQGLFSNQRSFPSPKFHNRKWGRNNNDLGMKDCFQTNAPSPPLNSTLLEFGGGREGVSETIQFIHYFVNLPSQCGRIRLRTGALRHQDVVYKLDKRILFII